MGARIPISANTPTLSWAKRNRSGAALGSLPTSFKESVRLVFFSKTMSRSGTAWERHASSAAMTASSLSCQITNSLASALSPEGVPQAVSVSSIQTHRRIVSNRFIEGPPFANNWKKRVHGLRVPAAMNYFFFFRETRTAAPPPSTATAARIPTISPVLDFSAGSGAGSVAGASVSGGSVSAGGA